MRYEQYNGVKLPIEYNPDNGELERLEDLWEDIVDSNNRFMEAMGYDEDDDWGYNYID